MANMTAASRRMERFWPVFSVVYLLCAVLYGATSDIAQSPFGILLAVLLVPVLFGGVFAAVYHSELIAIRVGEPFGTLVLTGAVTIIEVALITSVMAAGEGSATLVRDSVFAVLMLVCNGLVGLCILIGSWRWHEQTFRVSGAGSYLMAVMTLATLTLVMPNYTTSVPGPYYSAAQLAFVSLATVAIYGGFLYIQTVRHRDHFVLELDDALERDGRLPSNRAVAASVVYLLIILVVIVMLAKKFAAVLAVSLSAVGAPMALGGLVVAFLVLLPEATAAISAAWRNQLQKSINLALGSTLATIGLTIPAVAMASAGAGRGLALGLDAKDTVLLVLTFTMSQLTFATGRTNILSGIVHLVLFVTYVFFLFAP